MTSYSSASVGQDLKAIETEYGGIRFRSRLEARWAMLFDALGIRWEYEAEGYEYGYAEDTIWRYLPDFYLPDHGYWCEVKGDVRGVTDDYLHMLGNVGHFLPGVSNSAGSSGVILLGPIPRIGQSPTNWVPTFVVVSHRKGCALHRVVFKRHGVTTVGSWCHECEEWDLPYFGAQDLWAPGIAMSGDAPLVRDALAAARRHRFWNPS